MNPVYIAVGLILFTMTFYTYTENIIPMILVICLFGVYTLVYVVDCKKCKSYVESFMNYFDDDYKNTDKQIALREKMLKAIENIYTQLIPAQKRLNALRQLKSIDEEENDELFDLENKVFALKTNYTKKIQEFQQELAKFKKQHDYHNNNDNSDVEKDLSDVEDLTNQTDDEIFIRACHVKPSTIVYNKNPDPSVWIRKDSIPCWGCNP
jgi:hypothetical protein